MNMDITVEAVDLTMADYLDAENAAGGNHPMNFSAQLMVRRFQPVTPDIRPLTMVDIHQLAPAAFLRLLTAQRAVEQMRDGCSSLEILQDSARYVQKLLGRTIPSLQDKSGQLAISR